MTRTHSPITLGGLMVGAALLAKGARERRVMNFGGRVAFITGGSRGIG